MLARIVAIESGNQYIDKKRRVTLKFEDGVNSFRGVITLLEESLGLRDVAELDKVLVVEFTAQGGNRDDK